MVIVILFDLKIEIEHKLTSVPFRIIIIDMVVGVSAGSIVALALCSGLTPLQAVELWEQEAVKIFTEGWTKKITT